MRKQATAKPHGYSFRLAMALVASLAAPNLSYAEQTTIELNAAIGTLCEVTPQFNSNSPKTLPGITENGKITDSQNWIAFGDISCNYGATLSLKTQNGGLKRSGTPIAVPEGFTDRIPYTANATWGPISINLAANGVAGGIASKTAAESISNDLAILVETAEDLTKTVLEGNYIDILTVKVGAPF